MTTVPAMESFADELCKIAATRAAKLVNSFVAQAKGAFKSGNKAQGEAFLAQANKLSKTPGAIKSSPGGSQLKRGIRGAGSEGSVTEVMDPQFGIAMRKTYDPKGLSTEQLIKRKDVAGKAIGKSDDVAEYYGQRATPSVQVAPGVQKRTKGTVQFSEPVYSAPKVSDPNVIGRSPDYAAAKERGRAAYANTPYSDPQDIRAANMIRDVRTGKLKTVDTIPARPGEFISQEDRAMLGRRAPENALMAITDAGENLVKTPTRAVDPNQLNRSLLGTGSPRLNRERGVPRWSATGQATIGPASVPRTAKAIKQAPTMEPGTIPARPMAMGSKPMTTPQPSTRATAIQRPQPSTRANTVQTKKIKPPMGPAQAMAPQTRQGF